MKRDVPLAALAACLSAFIGLYAQTRKRVPIPLFTVKMTERQPLCTTS